MKEERRREEGSEILRKRKGGEKEEKEKGVYTLSSITLVSDIICSITLSKNLIFIVQI